MEKEKNIETKEKKKIVIADDDVDFLLLLKTIIQKMKHEVITAESQEEAEKILETMRPDLAIYDLMMENEDSGFILAYKTKKKYPDVPVMIISGVTSHTGISFSLGEESERKWIKADVFLSKGIRPDQLRREINRLLKI